MKHSIALLAVLGMVASAAGQPAGSTAQAGPDEAKALEKAMSQYRDGMQHLQKAADRFQEARDIAEGAGIELPDYAQAPINLSERIDANYSEAGEEWPEPDRPDDVERPERPDQSGEAGRQRGPSDTESGEGKRRGPPAFVSERVPSFVTGMTPSFVFG